LGGDFEGGVKRTRRKCKEKDPIEESGKETSSTQVTLLRQNGHMCGGKKKGRGQWELKARLTLGGKAGNRLQGFQTKKGDGMSGKTGCFKTYTKPNSGRTFSEIGMRKRLKQPRQRERREKKHTLQECKSAIRFRKKGGYWDENTTRRRNDDSKVLQCLGIYTCKRGEETPNGPK